MVIAQKDGIIFVNLADGEFLPENLNNEKVVVMRQGESTGRQLKIVKPLGKLATPDLLRPPAEPVCNYTGDGDTLHKHEDGTWWFYDEAWAFENGPYGSYDTGWAALTDYCKSVLGERISLTNKPESDKVVDEAS